MKFVVGQQLHATREVLFQCLHRELETCGLVGGNVVERLLESQAVERGRSIGVKTVQEIRNPLFSLWRLEIGIVLHRADYGYGGAGVVRLDDQAKAVGKGRVG